MTDSFDIQLNRLKSASPVVTEYIDGQFYLAEYTQDEITEDLILIECCTILVRELRDMGIIIHADAESMYTDPGNRHLIYLLRIWFEQDNIEKYLAGNTKLKAILTDQVGSTEPNDDLVLRILEICRNRSPLHPVLSQLEDAQDKICSNSEFAQYMTGILSGIEEIDLPEIDDLDQYAKFMEYLEDHLSKVTKNLEMLMTEDPELDRSVLRQRINVHDRDKLATGVINTYVWAYHIEENGLDSELEGPAKELFDKYDLKHHQSNYHHWEYYPAHPEHIISREDVAEMVADASAKSETVDEFKDRMTKIATNLTLTAEQSEWFIAYSQILYPGEQ